MRVKRILLMGTLDTKATYILYLRERIRQRGHMAIVMDLSMGGNHPFEADIRPQEILERVGKHVDEIWASRDRFSVTEAMIEGARAVALELVEKSEIHGIIAIGGATMALVAGRVMQVLPFGMPKLIGVTAAMAAYVKEWFDASDMSITQVIVDFQGMNDLLRQQLDILAGAICGMVESAKDYRSLSLPSPCCAITELGFSSRCAEQVKRLLEARGYHTISFHAQGISDRVMDRLIEKGCFDCLIDICPAGLIEEALQGTRAAGFERLDAPLKRGMPLVLAPCGLNITGCGPTRAQRDRYVNRERVWKMDELRYYTRLNREELGLCARLYAEKLNKAKGRVRFLIPLKGFSSIDRPGMVLHDPEEDRILIEELRRLVQNRNVEFVEIDSNLEDPEFALALVENLDELFEKRADLSPSHPLRKPSC